MSVKVLFFAQCADWMNKREVEIPVARPVRMIDMIGSSPELKPILAHLRALQVALNREIASLESEVRDGDEVAFLPPVSGG